MKALVICLAAICLCSVARGETEPAIRSVQQSLKDQGFYYGTVTGNKDADTTAAIRRYQIRNGLQITGELNNETRKSLGLKGAAPAVIATPAPRPTVSPSRTATPNVPRRDDLRPLQKAPSNADEEFQAQPPAPDTSTPFAMGRPRPDGLTSSLFARTPYETAPAEMQRRVLVGAQSLLARQGLYRGSLDGVYGSGMQFALRAYQSRFDIPATGRLDSETLGALGLLPGQQAPGVTAPRRRVLRRPSFAAPGGERIYTPNPY